MQCICNITKKDCFLEGFLVHKGFSKSIIRSTNSFKENAGKNNCSLCINHLTHKNVIKLSKHSRSETGPFDLQGLLLSVLKITVNYVALGYHKLIKASIVIFSTILH